MKRIPGYILFLILFSCNQNTNKFKILDFGTFKLTTPYEWNKIERQGIDSYVGGLTNGTDTLWFDYGIYGANLHQDTFPNKFAIDTVNGLPAEISIPKISMKGFYSLYISRVNENNKFILYGQVTNGQGVIVPIFKSLIFKESDTANNPPLTEDKFSKTLRGTAGSLFKNNCAMCHKINFDFTGPALKDVFTTRNKEWVYLFLTNRNQIKTDSTRQALIKKYQLECRGYSNLTREEVYAIYNYCL